MSNWNSMLSWVDHEKSFILGAWIILDVIYVTQELNK